MGRRLKRCRRKSHRYGRNSIGVLHRKGEDVGEHGMRGSVYVGGEEDGGLRRGNICAGVGTVGRRLKRCRRKCFGRLHWDGEESIVGGD